MELSIVLPTYNEVKSLQHVIERWHIYLKAHFISHIFIICEDGSTDGTKELVLELEKIYPIINQSASERRGYGGGVLAGINACTTPFMLCIDSDGQCMPDSFLDLWNKRNEYDIVIGIRSPRNDPTIRLIYSFMFHVLYSILFGSKVKDPSCPYILAPLGTYKKLRSKLGYVKEGFWWGFIGAACMQKMSICQVSIVHFKRYDGSTVVYKLGKMPGIVIRNIYGLIKLRFSN